MRIGFSTGSLARGDFRLALQILERFDVGVVELSALREDELPLLLNALDELPLWRCEYVSVHAPSKFVNLTERALIEELRSIAERGWPIIVHPDVISEFSAWEVLGDRLCLENMDKRKRTGRTAAGLARLFDRLPQARLCLDVGHARQIDPTMFEAFSMLTQFPRRLEQIHASFVNSRCGHEPLNLECVIAFRRIVPWIPAEIPVILESPVPETAVLRELERARALFSRAPVRSLTETSAAWA